MYLLDTNVISEIRKLRTGRMDPQVETWLGRTGASYQFLSAITVMELEIGTLQMERRDPRQGELLRRWIEQAVLPAYNGRVINVDAEVARRCASLHVPDPCSYRDALIAATALVHGMTVVTRNVNDFLRTGVRVLNPWETL